MRVGSVTGSVLGGGGSSAILPDRRRRGSGHSLSRQAGSAQGSLPGPVLETVRETFALIQLPGGWPLSRHLTAVCRCRCPPGRSRGLITARLDSLGRGGGVADPFSLHSRCRGVQGESALMPLCPPS